MKRMLILMLFTLGSAQLHAQSPASFGKKVKYMPEAYEKPSEMTNSSVSGGSSDLPWIVFSDRDENYTTTAPGGSLIMKKLNFMEPFYVSKEENGYLKLIQYKAGMIRGRKINDKKSAISYGWIPKSKLLLWQRSYSNGKTGYPEKSIAIINGKLPLTEAKFFYDNTDSLYIYSSPELKKRTTKIRLHEITYVYKKSEDGKKYLVGNQDQLVADSARKSIYGWVACEAVHSWGDRLFISPKELSSRDQDDSVSMVLSSAKSDPLLDWDNVFMRSSPVMVANDGSLNVGVANDVYSKTNNKIITINGASLTYQNYLDLRKNIHKINVIFVIDGGSPMTKYFSGLINTIQSFENTFNDYGRNHKISYGAVVYRDGTNCLAPGILKSPAVSADYRQLISFLSGEAKKTERCNGRVVQQPVYDGLTAGLELLKDHKNETNLVVLIGSTGNEGNSNARLNQLTSAFAQVDARLLSIQMYSDYDPSFNNFVLQSKKLVSNSAAYTAERKKRFLVKGEGLTESQSYNTSRTDSISFYLDYPKNSLIQGGVVFPTKGSVNSNESMTFAMRRFIRETDYDISNQISSLDSAFRLTGIARKNLAYAVEQQLEAPVSADVADRMPHNGFKYFTAVPVAADVVEKNNHLMQYSIVLNTMEYKQINDIFSLMIGQNLQPDQSSFRKDLAKNYWNIADKFLDLNLSKGEVKSMKLSQYIQTVTGLPVTNDLLTKYSVNDLRKENKMPQSDFESYLKFLISSSENFKRESQLNQQFISNGKTYYYITQKNFEQPTSEKETAQL
ncbi:hypothetical protein PBAL39_14089 [Pedobacter sp. BAL39]|uniref:type VI secretion system protein TssR domain-containing protein n=1 Tax=Pedobacter sp. BAL39 TaxID=391596 RepID=UPI000155AB32|nr:type VI secretion system protein TssR domain-containing protein [Pedobacter sp. BAL39]EDM34693.1 hypothetical protein PBAL39_14089 [Pedobacter sp. BAL39]